MHTSTSASPSTSSRTSPSAAESSMSNGGSSTPIPSQTCPGSASSHRTSRAPRAVQIQAQAPIQQNNTDQAAMTRAAAASSTARCPRRGPPQADSGASSLLSAGGPAASSGASTSSRGPTSQRDRADESCGLKGNSSSAYSDDDRDDLARMDKWGKLGRCELKLTVKQ
ncbi:hypothetical protein V8E36_006239, partial [Tilletia maclaganii]